MKEGRCESTQQSACTHNTHTGGPQWGEPARAGGILELAYEAFSYSHYSGVPIYQYMRIKYHFLNSIHSY